MKYLIVLFTILWLAGCSDFPEYDLDAIWAEKDAELAQSSSDVADPGNSWMGGESSSSMNEVSSSSSATAPITGTFTDYRDGTTYKYVQIGTQVWMAENLRYLPSLNGTDYSYDDPKYYVYNYTGTDVSAAKNTANYSKYGALYNWPAAMTACPAGWHLPTDAEWTALENAVGGSSTAGQKLKATSGWTAFSGIVNEDAYGFGALPGGYFTSGGFYNGSYSGHWWSATESNASYAYYRNLYYDSDSMYRYDSYKYGGFSVRCLQDY